jgi:hypothetical protein
MNSSGVDTVAARIAGLEFAVALLAKLVHEQGLASHSKIEEIMEPAAGGTRAATVVKMLSAITELVAAQEARAAEERRPMLCVVTPFPITATLLNKGHRISDIAAAAPRGASLTTLPIKAPRSRQRLGRRSRPH